MLGHFKHTKEIFREGLNLSLCVIQASRTVFTKMYAYLENV